MNIHFLISRVLCFPCQVLGTQHACVIRLLVFVHQKAQYGK